MHACIRILVRKKRLQYININEVLAPPPPIVRTRISPLPATRLEFNCIFSRAGCLSTASCILSSYVRRIVVSRTLSRWAHLPLAIHPRRDFRYRSVTRFANNGRIMLRNISIPFLSRAYNILRAVHALANCRPCAAYTAVHIIS